jgi:biotin carboxylase
MAPRPVLVVGYAAAALSSLEDSQPDGSLIFVEEPDVVRKRDVTSHLGDSAMVGGLIPFEYGLPGAADEFYHLHADLDPIAVVPIAEYGTPFAARLAERYGLPGAGYGAAVLLRDKELLRRVTRTAGIANPVSVAVAGPAELRAFAEAHPGPVVLKPANRQASVGTKVLAGPAEAEAAWAASTVHDEGVFVSDRPMPLRMLAEEYVSGEEYSVELLVRGGETLFSNVTGKVLYPGPYPVEQAHVVPAILSEAQTTRLVAETERVVAAVGFDTGMIHCEWIVADGVPHLVECAGRFAGDGIVELIQRAYLFDLVPTVYKLLKGEPVEDLPEEAFRAAAVWFLAAEPGVVESVTGVEEAAAREGVLSAVVHAQPGDTTVQLVSSWQRLGNVLALAADPQQALALAQDVADGIEIKVRPAD